jgi:hypothetical protein
LLVVVAGHVLNVHVNTPQQTLLSLLFAAVRVVMFDDVIRKIKSWKRMLVIFEFLLSRGSNSSRVTLR